MRDRVRFRATVLVGHIESTCPSKQNGLAKREPVCVLLADCRLRTVDFFYLIPATTDSPIPIRSGQFHGPWAAARSLARGQVHFLLTEPVSIIRALANGPGFEVRKMAMRTRTRKRTRWLIGRILLCILLVVSLATVVVTGRFWWQQQANRPTGSAATPEALKEKLEAYDKRADELERLLTLLLMVSTVYAIALGFSAYRQLKDAEKEIDRLPGEIASIKKAASEDLQEFVVKVESKFPLFADMDISIHAIMDQLIRLLPVIDSSEWSEKEYRRFTHEKGQEILFYEKTVAALVYFDLQRAGHIRQTVSEIYHGLGNFYGLKYHWEGKQDEDRERARFYLERAIHHDTENAGALNDRGYLAIYLDDPPDKSKAKTLFSKSLEVDPEQQRAKYDLAYLEHADGNYRRSQELLSEALLMKRWQNKSPARNRNSILYNRACAYARLGELEKAIVDLEEVFPDGADYTAAERTELVTQFKDDIRLNEDLYSLTQSEPFTARIKTIAARLS